MTLLRVMILFLILTVPPVHQLSRQPDIVYTDDLISLGNKQGLRQVEKIINPLKLIFLDTTLATQIVEWEMRETTIVPHPDSAGYYVVKLPRYALDIAAGLDNQRAVDFLFLYYCSLPRLTHSDTLFPAFGQLDRFFTIFTGRMADRKTLEDRLKSDFQAWSCLALSNNQVKYRDPEVEYDRFVNLNPLNSFTDARYISLLCGLALQQIDPAEVSGESILSLRKTQLTIDHAKACLPVLDKVVHPYVTPVNSGYANTIGNFATIQDFAGHSAELQIMVSNWLKRENLGENLPFSRSTIIVKPPDKAYFEVYYEFGMQGLRLTLTGNKRIRIEKILEVLD